MRSIWKAPIMHRLVGLCIFSPALALCQGYGDPLTIQGLDHTTPQSAVSRAEGGTTIGILNDAGLMFLNPASLQPLKGFQISIGGIQQYSRESQVQQYTPLKYYSNFSLLMEGLTGYIPNPSRPVSNPNAGDTVQRPFDTMGPNWSRSGHRGTPGQIVAALPFRIGGRKFVAGAGFVQYADVSTFFQNNNVLSPSIGSERPVPVQLPRSDSLPVPVQWSQYLQSRDGMIRGYGAAISGPVSDDISMGVSAMLLKGSSNDYEQHVGRGTLVFYTNYFRLDSVYDRVILSGGSEYSGQEFTVSGIYRGKYLTLGFAVKPPTTITRTYDGEMRADTTGSSSVTAVSYEDKLKLPWRGTFGLSLALRENLRLGLEYEIRSLALAVYRAPDGSESNPWISSNLLHVGAEFDAASWLTLRAGIRGQAEVFQEAGNPLDGDPVTYSVYSAGVGFRYGHGQVNLTYEYAPMKYQDMWQTNVNLNNDTRHFIIAELSYDIPF